MNLTKHTLGDILLWRYKKSPKQDAIGTIKKKKISFHTFEQYKAHVETLSLAFLALGLKAQDKLAILSHTREQWHYIDLATISIGGISIPIYPSYTADEIEYIINHSDSDHLVIEDKKQFLKIIKVIKKLSNLKTIISIDELSDDLISKIPSAIKYMNYEELVSFGHEELKNHPDTFAISVQDVKADDIATIVYTSGTTGQPKGAVIRHEALTQVLLNIRKYAQGAITSKDRLLTFLPLSHVLGRTESFFPLAFGCESIYAESIDALLGNIATAKPTLMIAVPRIFEKIYEKVQNDLQKSELKKSVFEIASNSVDKYFEKIDNDQSPSGFEIIQYQIAKKLVFETIYQKFGGRIRFFISGGAPLSIEIMKFLRNAGLTVLEGYGLTETIAPCCVNPMSYQHLGTVGQPIGDVQIRFDSDGEILIKSKAIFSEYYKNPEATSQSIDDEGWFRSGDIGEFDPSGFLRITDRKKDIIITSGGKNIAPQKIENKIKLSPLVSHVAIIGDKQKYLTALIGIEKESLKGIWPSLKLDSDCEFAALSESKELMALIQEGIDQVNSTLASHETVKIFTILPVELNIKNYLTPSFKVKKKLVIKDFSYLIDAMYK